MLKNKVFDNEKYLKEQSRAILERIKRFDNKLYLEFGGKLLYDYHAARVLVGFEPNIKVKLLHHLKDKLEIIICIYAGDIERRKIRSDFGITYEADVLKLIDDLREQDLNVRAVVITRFHEQPAAKIFKNKLERQGIKVYTHRFTKDYPTDVDTIVSDDGYGANEYIVTEKPLVVVAGPGPGSGKLATCLSQLYHDYKRNIKSGYAKFETFPVWNLSLRHPVNVAYEAAIADIRDFNMVDPFHLEAYGITAINYNRDVEIFPVLSRILKRITGSDNIYRSPTDMGVNCVNAGIIDEELAKEAAKQEVIRRYFQYSCDYLLGLSDKETIERLELLMQELGIKPEDRKVVIPARQAALEAQEKNKGNEGVFSGAAKLPDGSILTGKSSPLMHAASSLIFNAIKKLAGIPDNIHLLSPNIIHSIRNLKKDILGSKSESLNLEEIMIALSMSATNNPAAQAAMEKLKELKDCEVHLTHIPPPGDEVGLRRLGVNFTSEPNFSSKRFFF